MARVLTLLRGFFFRDTRPLWEMGLGAFIALLLAFAAMHLAWMAVHFGQTMLIILVLAACYTLYLIRHFSRLAYGMVEIAIGMFAIFGAMGRSPAGRSRPIDQAPCSWCSSLLACTSLFAASTIGRSRHLSQAAPYHSGRFGI